MAAVAPLIEYHRRDLLHSRGVVPFQRELVAPNEKPPPLIVADQRALATLFALPWRAGPATLVVQNVGGALVLESGGVIEEEVLVEKKALPTTPAERTKAALEACTALAKESQTSLTERRREEAQYAERCARQLAPANDDDDSYETKPHEPYARVRRWRLGDLSLLSGSDCALLGGGCALRLSTISSLQSSSQKRLAALDCWLDAILTGAPRVALCLSNDEGLVVGGRIVDVCEVPHTLAGRGQKALFDIRTINEDAIQLLRFLAKHCNKEGATYVLTTRGQGAHIELYDVNRLADTSKRHWKWLLATLAARIARRLGAHLRSSEDVSDELRERHGALIDSALDLLGEVRDLGGASHDALRRSLHEAGALALLPGFVPSTQAKSAWRFFGCASTASDGAGFERLDFDVSTLERARRRFEMADITDVAIDCALALAKRHLEAQRPAELMHEIRRCLKAELSKAREAGLRHVACAFAHEAARDPHGWCAKGVVPTDARKLLEDIGERFGDPGGDAARAARNAALDAHEDGVAPRYKADAVSLRAAAAEADRSEEATPSSLAHAVQLAASLEAALSATRLAFGPSSPEALAVAARLGASQATVGARLQNHATSRAWLHAALCRLHACGNVDNEARVRLEVALSQKRAAASLLDRQEPGNAVTVSQEAQRAGEAALAIACDANLKLQAAAEIASCALLEALAAAKAGKNAERAFDRAVAVAATPRGAACARLQRGRFLASLATTQKRRETRVRDLATASQGLRESDPQVAAAAARELAAFVEAPGDLLLAVRALAQTNNDGALLTATAKRLLACTRHGDDPGAAAARAACKACYGAALRGDAPGAAAALEPLFSRGGV
jgi:hypothetical protein